MLRDILSFSCQTIVFPSCSLCRCNGFVTEFVTWLLGVRDDIFREFLERTLREGFSHSVRTLNRSVLVDNLDRAIGDVVPDLVMGDVHVPRALH